MFTGMISSPFGPFFADIENGKLVRLDIVERALSEEDPPEVFKDLSKQLNEYFEGKRKTFSIPIETGKKRFEGKVLETMQEIPYGETVSYSELANMSGNPHAARAVGNACAKNKILILIPCHRVIKKGGDINRFGAGIGLKRKLLRLEGNVLDGDKIIK